MKRYKKKELLEIIKMMEQINDFIGRNVEIIELDQLMKMLENCQQTAIDIGHLLEEEGTVAQGAVKILETYCENIYEISLVFANSAKIGRLVKKIQSKLTNIANAIQYDIPNDKKEIVFLPYKASMWDSLESVWRAADADENCNVHVIPIPYFDKNVDGTFGELHYEGKEYPADVPITSWEEYIIEEQHPDIIYIHNPYDGGNTVTSVHPAFYAKKLKKYTEALVYIPYFVGIDDVQEHFCVLPGTLHADRVIVQSEKVRDTYIRQFHKFEEENNCKGYFGDAEEKFLALGSPKFDKVMQTGRWEVQIPVEWEKSLYKEDGSRKKVVLYNTTIDAILYHPLFLEKMKKVFEQFEKEEEIVLLWRPHPLYKATLKAMKPEIFPLFKEIEKKFKELEQGIYDESADLYRAIAISDAYYGDWSSLVELYKRTGKAIMIQNLQKEETITPKKKLIFECITEYQNVFFAPSMEYNGLFCIQKNGASEFISIIPQEPLDKKHLYADIKTYKNYLILVPRTAEKICIYDIEKKVFIYRKLEVPITDEKFSSSYLKGDDIYFLSDKLPYVVKMELLTWDIEYISLNGNGEFVNLKRDFVQKKIIEEIRKENHTIMFIDVIQEKYFFYRCKNSEVIWDKQGEYVILDANRTSIEIMEFEIINYFEMQRIIISKRINQEGVIKEREPSDIKILCSIASRYESGANGADGGLSGEKIHQSIKGIIRE